jgi:hypothetical protein
VKPEATQEEIDDMINTVNEDGQIFTQSVSFHSSKQIIMTYIHKDTPCKPSYACKRSHVRGTDPS